MSSWVAVSNCSTSEFVARDDKFFDSSDEPCENLRTCGVSRTRGVLNGARRAGLPCTRQAAPQVGQDEQEESPWCDERRCWLGVAFECCSPFGKRG
jgi:hypothetical protein